MHTSLSAVAGMSHWFGVQRGPAALLVELLRAEGSFVSAADLAIRCGITTASVKYRISELRKVMATEAVDTLGSSYGLTHIGLAECRAALYQLAAELADSAGPVAKTEQLAA